MVDKRPININPLSIKLPITAIISITHRISGVFIFLLIPFILWCLQNSLASENDFNQLAGFFGHWLVKGTLFILIASLLFHILAGIRHLLMDMHLGESFMMARVSSWLVILSSVALTIMTAIWLWG